MRFPKSGVLAALLFLLSCGGEPALPGDESDLSGERIRFPEGSGGVNAPVHLDAPYVVLVSLDGFRHDYLDIFETPNLDRIVERGFRAEGLTPVFPVKTFPNHYSIATGMYADAHGLVGNRFYEPAWDAYYAIGDRAAVEDGRWYGGEPIWVTAETQGMVASSYFFVGTEAPVMGVQPTEWFRFSNEVPYADRVDKVLEWLNRPADVRPHMISLYFEETDSKGHNFPTDSPEMREAVATVDGMIGRLLDGIEELPHGGDVHVVVVSDHGMGPFLAEQTYNLPDLIDLGPDVETIEIGPHMLIYVDGDEDRVSSLRAELADVLPNVTVFQVGDMPERLHYSRAGGRLGDLVLMPDFGWSVVPWSAAERPARSGWTHGWHRDTPEMQGLLIAMGPRIRQGSSLGLVENVHVYPMIAEILGLQPNPEIDGRLEVLQPIMR